MRQPIDTEQPPMQLPLANQQQDGQRQSQWQGRRTPEKPQPTTADPGADGQSVYDVQDAEALEPETKPLAPPWKSRPDSNAM